MKKQRQLIVSASILSADPLNLGTELQSAESAGVDWHHIDVMDGHFVPNLSFGLPLVRAIRASSQKILDVHIMVSNPDDVALSYCEAGSDYLSFHVEASKDPMKLIRAIRDAKVKPGIAIKPDTPIDSKLDPFLASVELVNLMSVQPGFSGQQFLPNSLDKLRLLKMTLDRLSNHTALVQVDGGVNLSNAKDIINAGGDALVVGNYFYKTADRHLAVKNLRKLT